MKPIPSNCPICGGTLTVTQIMCPACETVLSGSFSTTANTAAYRLQPDQLRVLHPFAVLSPEQLFFLVTFVRCEGRLNRMEEELALSYPTLRVRLDDMLQTLGIEPAREEGAAAIYPDPAERQMVLDMLHQGDIDVQEAQRRLRGEISTPSGHIQPEEKIE